MKRLSVKKTNIQGLTLVELMVAITIGMFMLLALFSVFISFKKSSQSQTGIAQMQDDQRMVMTILSQVIQSAGYFANPVSNTASSVFAIASAGGSNFSVGVPIYGTDSGAASSPDTLYVRYQSAQNDGVVNCQGGTNASSTTATYINQLSVASSALQFTCALFGAGGNGTAQALVGGNASGSAATACSSVGYLGISNIKFLYGVGGASGSVTSYASAGAVSNWANVYSIQPTVTQLYCAQQGSLPQAVTFSRIIFLPNQL